MGGTLPHLASRIGIKAQAPFDPRARKKMILLHTRIEAIL